MKNNNLWIFISLVILTLSSYFFSELSGETIRVELLLLFASLKVFLVAFYFMELKKAHFAWVIIMGLVLIVFTGSIFALNFN